MNFEYRKKILTLIFCVVLIASGLFIMIPTAGANDNTIVLRGARAPEAPGNNTTNDYPPTIVKNSPLAPNNNFTNAAGTQIVFNITLTDDDEPPNGSHIANASVHVGVFGAAPSFAAMEFWNFTGSNVTRQTGRWVYNFTLPAGAAPGRYFVNVNASDAGNITDSNKNQTYNNDTFEIILHQENRAPTQNDTTVREVMCDEDAAVAYFELDEIFADEDVDNPPPYTNPDSLMFEMWDGAAWTTSYDFGNYTITVDDVTGNLTFVPDANWFNAQDASNPASVPAEDKIMFRVNDTHQANVTHNLTFRVTSVNDLPALAHPSLWIIDANLTFNVDEFDGYENTGWSIQALAEDVDLLNPVPDTLTFGVENSAELPTMMAISSAGLFNFTPTNDDVGIYMVNVTVTDGTATDTVTVYFDIANVNDDPVLMMVHVGANWVPIIFNSANLAGANSATEDEEFKFTVEAADDDIDHGDTLSFSGTGPSSLVMDFTGWGATKWNFSFTPTNDDALYGYESVTVNVYDEASTTSDWATLTIDVNNVNDAPVIVTVDYYYPYNKMVEMAPTYKGEYDNFSISAEDIDGDTLTLIADNKDMTITAIDEDYWDVSFHPTTSGIVTVNFTVSDGQETDYVLATWDVMGATPPEITISTVDDTQFAIDENIVIDGTWYDEDDHEIEIQVLITFPNDMQSGFGFFMYTATSDTDDDYGYDYLVVNTDGSWQYVFNPDDYKMIYDVAVMMGLGDFIGGPLDAGTYNFAFKAIELTSIELESIEESVDIILGDGGVIDDADDDGMPDDWEDDHGLDKYDDSDADDDNDDDGLTNLEEYVFGSDPTDEDSDNDGYNDNTEYLAGTDPNDSTSYPSGPPDEPDEGDDDDDEDLGALAAGIAIVLILIIVVIIIVVVVVTRKKKAAPAYAPPPAPLACTACGVQLPAGAQTCPSCGAPAPAPVPAPAAAPEGAPPAPVPCAACGVQIPVGYAACPSCGAPTPVPPPPPESEAPPEVVTCITCGATIPPGSPTCTACGAPAPPTGPPLESTAAPETGAEAVAEEPPVEEAPPEGAPPPTEEAPAPPPEQQPDVTWEDAAPPSQQQQPPPQQPPPQSWGEPPPTQYQQQYYPPQPQGQMAPPPYAPAPQQQMGYYQQPPPEQQQGYYQQPPPQQQTMPCPNCGAPLADGTVACVNCGAELDWD